MRIKREVDDFLPGGIIRISFIVTIFLLLIAWIVPVWRLHNVDIDGFGISLHSNIYFGVDYIDSWMYVMFYPGFATVVFLLNTWLMERERKRNPLLAKMLAVSSVLVALFIIVALFFVIMINI